jgi:glycosyltransferase involved in cell wall biosynthesis
VSSFVQHFLDRHLLDGRQRSVMIPDIGTSGQLDNSSPPSRGQESRSAALPSEPYILFVGGLTAAKGLEVLLAAYRQLPAPPPLVLIGTVWPDTPREFPPGVTVIRNLPNREVLNAWARSLFGVQPSLTAETFGMAIVEAMSRGKAVIASRLGGVVDVVADGTTGILVTPGSTDELARAMQRLSDDPLLRERLGRAGRARAELFTAATVVPRFEALYKDLARPQPSPRIAAGGLLDTAGAREGRDASP